jgi:uncharacterized membrane protein
LTFLFFALSIMIVSCRHKLDGINTVNNGNAGGSGGSNGGGPGQTCDPAKIYFQQQVLPILVSNCAMSGCHDESSHQDGVVLTTYEKVMSTAGIRPGRPNDSELYERINDNDPDDRMPQPPRSPLTSEQKQIIFQWISQGAQNLSCQNLCDSNSYTYAGAIKTLITNKCQGCHSGAAASAGIDLGTYAGLKSKVTDGRLWGAINHTAGYSAMPKNGAKLSDCEISQIGKWIEAGSPNN